MSESSHNESDGARMVLEPDAILESEDGPAIDCPSCGVTNTFHDVVEEGRCTGRLDDGVTEVEAGDDQLRDGCGAKLSLELVWEEE